MNIDWLEASLISGGVSYLSEGGLHVVFSVACDCADGHILRVRKERRGESATSSRDGGVDVSGAGRYRCTLQSWTSSLPVMPARTEVVSLSAEAAETLCDVLARAEACALRPRARHGVTLAQPLIATLMRNLAFGAVTRSGATALRASCGGALAVSRRDEAFCVEIKPKCGAPPTAGAPACRFCMHQVLRAAEAGAATTGGNWAAHISCYCPMELFSGDEARVRSAVSSLLRHPRNNLRLFVGGALVYSEDSVAAHGGDASAALNSALARVPAVGGAQRLTAIIAAPLVAGTLGARLLRAVAAAQTGSPGGVDAAALAYDILSAASTAAVVAGPVGGAAAAGIAEGSDVADAEALCASLVHLRSAGHHDHSNPASNLPEALHIAAMEAHAHAQAASARDCSLMLALSLDSHVVQNDSTSIVDEAPAADGASEHADALAGRLWLCAGCLAAGPCDPAVCHAASVQGSARVLLRYSLALADADPKPLARIPRHRELERRMHDAYALHGAEAMAVSGKRCGGAPSASCSVSQ